MHPAVHNVSRPPQIGEIILPSERPPAWFPELGTVTVEAVGSLKAHGHLARLLEKVLYADPRYRIAVEVYAFGGLIYVRTSDGVLVADLFPTEARAAVRTGLVRIQHSLER